MSVIHTGVFDCDTHIYEPKDAATRYLPKQFQDRSIRVIQDASGEDAVLAGSRVANFLCDAGLGFEKAYRPGSLKQMLKEMGSGNPDETYQPEPMRPEFLEREPRMKLLDEQGVARCILYPGSIGLAGENYVSDTEALYANLSSYNRWYDE